MRTVSATAQSGSSSSVAMAMASSNTPPASATIALMTEWGFQRRPVVQQQLRQQLQQLWPPQPPSGCITFACWCTNDTGTVGSQRAISKGQRDR